MTDHQKIALVTGATRGVGRETVRQLAKSGIRVLLAGRNLAAATEAADAMRRDGLAVDSIALDVTDAGSIAAAVSHVGSTFGRLDILVNNAGVLLDDGERQPSEQPMQIWRDTFETNVFGLVEVTQAFLPLIKAAPAGDRQSVQPARLLRSAHGSRIADLRLQDPGL